mmetsp:Transcript_66055/g.175907  ORF Transcript_66055/g.175907 Transcript_66055/m.175907 type:complete len:82 (+) Transcript_66055:525-770(+)
MADGRKTWAARSDARSAMRRASLWCGARGKGATDDGLKDQMKSFSGSSSPYQYSRYTRSGGGRPNHTASDPRSNTFFRRIE